MSKFRRRLLMMSLINAGSNPGSNPEKLSPPLYIEALENDLYVQLSENNIEYSLDGKLWNTLPANTNTPAISSGEKIYFRGSNLIPNSTVGIGTFTISKKCNVAGNIMSLLFKNNYDVKTTFSGVSGDYVFYKLFYNCSNIQSVESLMLPATTLIEGCYKEMFRECTSIKITPTLPATTLANSCYSGMFRECTSINKASSLPATTLAEACYKEMYYGCPKLLYAPTLPAIELVTDCYNSMFCNCTKMKNIKALFITTPNETYTSNWVLNVSNSGNFIKNSEATWNVTGENGVPTGWNSNSINTSSPTIIRFTIQDASYQAEEFMSFGEWIDSEYNTGGFIKKNGFVFESTGEKSIYQMTSLNDMIKNYAYYNLVEPGAWGEYNE